VKINTVKRSLIRLTRCEWVLENYDCSNGYWLVFYFQARHLPARYLVARVQNIEVLARIHRVSGDRAQRHRRGRVNRLVLLAVRRNHKVRVVFERAEAGRQRGGGGG
jgi:hypothetical protein